MKIINCKLIKKDKQVLKQAEIRKSTLSTTLKVDTAFTAAEMNANSMKRIQRYLNKQRHFLQIPS